MKMYNFVCKGNLYRSRFASALFTHVTGISSGSFGTHYYVNEDVCPKYIEFVQKKYNLFVGGTVKQIDRHIILNSYRVYYMSDDNANCLSALALGETHNVRPLKIPTYHSRTLAECMEKVNITDPGYKPTMTQIENFTNDIYQAIMYRWESRIW